MSKIVSKICPHKSDMNVRDMMHLRKSHAVQTVQVVMFEILQGHNVTDNSVLRMSSGPSQPCKLCKPSRYHGFHSCEPDWSSI